MAETIVITGVSSFVGCHLARRFASRDYRTVGIVGPMPDEYEGLRGRRLQVAQDAGVSLVRLDFTDPEDLPRFVAAEKPTVWLQHGAWATDYASLAYDLGRGLTVNVVAQEPLVKALKESGCRGIVHTGTSWEYGAASYPRCEDDACWPTSPYGLAKLAQTLRARQLAQIYDFPTRVARLFIPYGPLDVPGKLLPGVIRSLKAGQPIDLSTCEQQRDVLYVEDLVTGYEAVVKDLKREESFNIFNLCSGEAIALRELLLEIAALLGADPSLLQFGHKPLRPGEEMLDVGCGKKARILLGWVPRPRAVGLQEYLAAEI